MASARKSQEGSMIQRGRHLRSSLEWELPIGQIGCKNNLHCTARSAPSVLLCRSSSPPRTGCTASCFAAASHCCMSQSDMNTHALGSCRLDSSTLPGKGTARAARQPALRCCRTRIPRGMLHKRSGLAHLYTSQTHTAVEMRVQRCSSILQGTCSCWGWRSTGPMGSSSSLHSCH